MVTTPHLYTVTQTFTEFEVVIQYTTWDLERHATLLEVAAGLMTSDLPGEKLLSYIRALNHYTVFRPVWRMRWGNWRNWRSDRLFAYLRLRLRLAIRPQCGVVER